jgi:hypothetical protein
MRYTEIINELKMSPNHLAKFGKTKGDTILAGFEAEMILNDVLDATAEPDYSVDQRIGWREDLDDLAKFFDVNRRQYNNALSDAEDQFLDWQKEKIQEYVDEHVEQVADSMADEYNDHNDDGTDDFERKDASDFHSEANDRCIEIAEQKLSLSFQDFCADHGIDKYSEFADYFNIEWPHTIEVDNKGKYDSEVANAAAEDIEHALGKSVQVNYSYHGSRTANMYHIEPDQSLAIDENTDMGIELISYPMPLPEMMDDLEKTMRYIDMHAYTNESTGLHINLSIPNGGEIDYVKLVLFLGDEYVLQQFDRESNTYARSAFEVVDRATYDYKSGEKAFELLQKGMIRAASKAIKERNLEKYTSVNMHDTYVEFRSMGGDYVTKWSEIKTNILRFAQALHVACDPEAERKAYALKMYKLLTRGALGKTKVDDAVRAFSMYRVGSWSKNQLVSFLKNRADQRKEDKAPF